jgi:hypothetical protein
MDISDTTRTVRTYHISPRRRWLLWYILGPIIVSLIWLGTEGDPTESRAFLITAALAGCIGILLQLVVVDRATLQLSPRGVRLRQAGYTLSTPWSTIVDFRLQSGREGFITREPLYGRGPGVLGYFRGVAVPTGLPMYDAEQQQLLSERRFIPIEAFAWHLRQGHMLEDIVRNAPHLAHLLLAERESGFRGNG